LPFVQVGCPVGIWLSGRDFHSAFVTCFLPILFVYYPLLACGNTLARRGRLPLCLAIWAADAVLLVLAVLLCRRLIRS
jgi:lipopolysaccharide export system permease protein